MSSYVNLPSFSMYRAPRLAGVFSVCLLIALAGLSAGVFAQAAEPQPAAESTAEPAPAEPVVTEPDSEPAVVGPDLEPPAGAEGEPVTEDGPAEDSADAAGQEQEEDATGDDEPVADEEAVAPEEEEEAAAVKSWKRNIWVQLLVFFLVIALPLGMAHLMKKAWRMPEYFTKFALILFCLFAGVAVIAMSRGPTLGIDLAGGSILIYELKEGTEVTAANQVGDLMDAIDEFQGDTGAPPTNEQGLQALFSDPGVQGWNGPYVTDLPEDPWGSDYRYELRGEPAEPFVWSTGEDRVTDEEDTAEEKKDDITSETTTTEKKVDMEALTLAVYKRVDPTGTSEINIVQYGARNIRITIPKADESETERIKRKISSAGTLEFRIVANSIDHADEIEQALAATESDILVAETRSGEEKRRAWWVRVAESAQGDFQESLFGSVEGGAQEVGYVAGRFVDVDGKGNPLKALDGVSDRLATELPAASRSVGIRKRADATGRERLEMLMMNDSFSVTGEYLTTSRRSSDEKGAVCVQFNFNSRGGQLFRGLTGDNLPDEDRGLYRLLAIVLEEELVSAPRINSIIGQSGIITGRFSREEVDDLVAVLNAGGLGADLSDEPVSAYYAGPLLGEEAIRLGGLTIGGSLILVLIFMLIYYRFAGIIACMAVLLNLVLLLALMILFNAAFTLPGIAGLVLTVGMAVDANVLIFERIREELNRDATLRMAIRNGFQRATTTVIDANLTTLITGVVLFAIGTEQVKGFAVILILGVLLSMFTAIFCSRVVFDVAEKRRWSTKLHMMRLIGKTEIDFIGMRRVAGVISLIVILLGLAGVAGRQKGLLDIDFVGGAEVEIVFTEKQDIDDIRDTLKKKLPDLSVAPVESEGGFGTRFRVNTSQKERMTPNEYVEYIEDLLNESFKNNLAHYEMIREGDPAKPAPSPEPKSDDQSRTDLPSDSLLASAEPSDVLLAQDDTPAVQQTYTELLRFPRGINYDALLLHFDDWKKAKADAGKSEWDSLQYQLHNPVHDAKLRKEGRDYSRYEEWTVTISNVTPAMADELLTTVQDEVQSVIYFPSSNTIGGAVATRTQTQAVTALLASLLCIVGYIWFRFQRMMFGLAAVVALVHDVLITLGALALSYWLAPIFLFGYLGIVEFKIGLPVLAAFLTIIGYSLNDTIVVFDRIREVRGKSPYLTADMINTSINQTLSRTLLTSVTTLLVVALLYCFGGDRIHTFAFALVIGVMVGTYSSIFVASPTLLWMAQATGVQKKKDA